MRNYLPIIVFVALCLTLANCGVMSVNPITAPEESSYDSRLDGIWTIKDDKSQVFLHVGKANENMTEIVYIEHKNNGSIDRAIFSAYPSKINNSYYANVQILDPKDEINLYFFLKYEFIDSNTLSISFLDGNIIQQLIENGKLKGSKANEESAQKLKSSNVVNTKMYIEITDSSKNIKNIIRNMGSDKLFKEAFVVKRLNIS